MKTTTAIALFGALLLLSNNSMFAHCDTMNGPVVTAARKALETGDVNLVLVWVRQSDETAIRSSFAKTLQVRKLSTEAMDLADRYFFETVVRIHRAGEGVPYTGLKPAETEVEPGIEAADKALESGSMDDLSKHLTITLQQNLRVLFESVVGKKRFASDNVAAGREYVAAYVKFIHYAEGLVKAASGSPEHSQENTPMGMHEHK